MGKKIVLAVVAVLVIGVAAVISLKLMSPKHTITGSITAPECGGGYDIGGASVEVRDESGKLVGAATTSLGETTSTGYLCTASFTVPDVPKAKFYDVTIGTHGGPSYTYEEMQRNEWTLELSLD